MTGLQFLTATLLLLQPGASSGFAPVSRRTSSSPSLPSPRRDVPTAIASASDDESGGGSFDASALRKRMSRQNNQYAELLLEQSQYAADGGSRDVPESVHIVLFHPGTERQHAHTIEFPKGSGNNLMLAFEGGGDCVAFARGLRDLEFADPCPEETMFEPFAQYCEMAGLSLVIVPKGFELTPPQLNANDDDDDSDDDDDDDDEGSRNHGDATIISDDVAVIHDDDDLDSWG